MTQKISLTKLWNTFMLHIGKTMNSSRPARIFRRNFSKYPNAQKIKTGILIYILILGPPQKKFLLFFFFFVLICYEYGI